MTPSIDGQLCVSGVPNPLSLTDALADSHGFSRCHALRIHVPVSLAAGDYIGFIGHAPVKIP